MKWSLLELNKYKDNPLEFSETLDLKESLMNRDNLILDVSPVKTTGMLTVGKDEYLIHYRIDVIVTVPSSRSLTPVPLTMTLDVDEVFMTQEQYQSKDDRLADEEIILLDNPTIDLDESVEDNILLAIPIQVLTEEEKTNSDMPKGDDWEVLSEEAYLQQRETEAQQTTDPRLAKLSELFNETTDNEDN
ncbi:YceD family protein [Enterococcus termitis]|uniref:Nucleic acid-binding protein n=1 Tax=Enterococcus termitis TaxID=332950 RepID=A0A1E5H825_9ENTE|nr:YceD family protein [Enterococcus termitis]OEG20790.1 nucleic acid-binding protein [Enterococcus termitis]